MSPSVLSHLATLHARNADTEARLPWLLLANLSSYPPDTASGKGRQSSAKAGSAVPAGVIEGAEPDLPIDPPILPETPIVGPMPMTAGPTVDLTSAYNNPSVSVTPSTGNAPPAEPFEGPSFDVNPKNFATPAPSRPSPLPTILGIGGGIAGTVLGGPIGGALGKFGGSLLGRLIASGALGNLSLPNNTYNPKQPVSVSNIPPFSQIGGVPQQVNGGTVSYQQSGDIMDRSRAGFDPNAAIFNPIRPFGPGSGANQSNGYYGAGISQGDQLAEAHLMAQLMERGGDADPNPALAPLAPQFQTPGTGGLPLYAPAPLPGSAPSLLALLLGGQGAPPPPAPVPPGP